MYSYFFLVSVLKMHGALLGVLCIVVTEVFPQSNPASNESCRSSKRLN